MELKNLIQLRSKEVIPLNNGEEVAEETRKRTYHEAGFRDSSRSMGHAQSLSVCFDAIYSKFENEEKELLQKQYELKKPYLQEQKAREGEIKGLQVAIENTEESIQHQNDKIDQIKEDIKELKFEIADIPQNPTTYVPDAKKGASVKFWLGLIMLIPITVYLFTFYSSVVYSAMVKNFTYDDQRWYVPNSIFLSWEEGWQALSTVIFAPFIFIGLGYLIHMFYQKKGWISGLKLFGVVGITFVFDVLLAFFIEKKLWELNRVDETARFGFEEAVQSQEFWLIIFLGFIAYLIWGFIFDFVLEEHKEKDKVKNAIRKRQNQIIVLNDQIQEIREKIGEFKARILEIRSQISTAKSRIEELQNILDGTIIPSKEYKLYASEYMQGWITFIGEKLAVSQSENDRRINECHEVYQIHLKAAGVRSDSHNTVFTKTL